MRSRRCLLGRAGKDLIVGRETIEVEKRDQHEGEPAGQASMGMKVNFGHRSHSFPLA